MLMMMMPDESDYVGHVIETLKTPLPGEAGQGCLLALINMSNKCHES